MLSGLISLCNTPAMCKPVTACKSPVVYCHTYGDTSPVTCVACNAEGNATYDIKQFQIALNTRIKRGNKRGIGNKRGLRRYHRRVLVVPKFVKSFFFFFLPRTW